MSTEKTTTIDHQELIQNLHIQLGQLGAIAWWMTDFRGDYEVDPEVVRQTGHLTERLVQEMTATVKSLDGQGAVS